MAESILPLEFTGLLIRDLVPVADPIALACVAGAVAIGGLIFILYRKFKRERGKEIKKLREREKRLQKCNEKMQKLLKGKFNLLRDLEVLINTTGCSKAKISYRKGKKDGLTVAINYLDVEIAELQEKMNSILSDGKTK